jgi:peptidoglycan/xylan/chitin deacetylase (PgdA/CDA1 family)
MPKLEIFIRRKSLLPGKTNLAGGIFMLKRIVTWVLSLVILCMPAVALEVESGGLEDAEEPLRLPVVMYHHISPKAKLWSDYVLSVDELESDLVYLKQNGYESITMEQLYAWYDGGEELPERPVLITFDDGYESTEVYAEPLLKAYGFTGVVAVIGSVCQQYTDVPDHMLDYSHMSWGAVAEMSRRGTFEVQCHTWNMHKLGARKGCTKKAGEGSASYKETIRADFSLFLDRCEEYGVELCGGIAYPFGAWCDDTREVARELGFRAAFTCTEKVNLLTGAPGELLELCRYNRPHGKSSEAFFSQWK